MSYSLPVTPFTQSTALEFVLRLEKVWNTQRVKEIIPLFSHEARWLYDDAWLNGRDAITNMLENVHGTRRHFVAAVDLLAFHNTRITCQVLNEWQSTDDGQWFQLSGVENLECDNKGLILVRETYAKTTKILEAQRQFK